MSNASSAGSLKKSLGRSGAVEFTAKISGAKRFTAGLCLALCASAVFAAPFNYVANYAGSTVTVNGTSTTYTSSVSVVDVSTSKIVATIPPAVAATTTTAATPGIGAGPLGVAINPAGTRVYVVNYGDSTDAKTAGTVSVIDADQTSSTLNTVIASVTVGVKPELAAVNPSGSTIYATNSVGNSVSVIDAATNKETTKIAVGGYPVGVAFTPDGKKSYVTLADKSSVAVIDTVANTVSGTVRLSWSNPEGIVIDPAGTFAYVADYASGDYGATGAVSVIDLSKGTEVATIPVGIGPIGIAISPDGGRVYVTNYQAGTVSVIDTATNKVIIEAVVGSGPLGISVDSKGTLAYVSLSGSGVLATFDLGLNALGGAASVGTTPNYNVITSSANMSVNLNQHGLNGGWYNPSASGLGFYLDAHPDANGVGNGILNMGWFTYDVTAAGGQRWYSLQGNVTSSDPVASLTIYTGTGGNFNAAPVVPATVVGQATLQFVDCMHGTLRYTFTDGSNRQGFFGLTRLTGNPTCTASGDSGPATGGYEYSGSWYNPETSGQGLILTVDPTASGGPLLYGGWFTYAPNGQQIAGGASQSWFALQSTQAGQGNSYAANIYTGSAGVFAGVGVKATTTNVGTANAVFTSCTTMSLTYNFTDGINKGLTNTMNLVRLGAPPTGCQ